MKAQIQLGGRITQPNDPLQRFSLGELYKTIRQEDSALARQTEQLRAMLEIDPKAYQKNKTALPYCTAGIFHPAFRKTEHFAAAGYFIFDFDHIDDLDILEDRFERLKQDTRVALLFHSPGRHGIKCFLQLNDQCADRYYFTDRYKKLLFTFSEEHQLTEFADYRTHDVTRACFIAHDPLVYINEEPTTIVLDAIQVEDNKLFTEQVKQMEQERKVSFPDTLPDPTLLRIKQTLNPDFKPKLKREIHVPPAITEMMPVLGEKLRSQGLQLLDTQPIQYGRQIRVGMDRYWAEVNIFYGQRGFSIVKTTKTGSTPELADLVYQLIYDLLIR
jgi:hypothetical protein